MATLVPRHAFGLKRDVKNNIWYVDENTVVYPCGHLLVIYNTETKQQKFIPGTEGVEAMTALALAPNRRCVAVAERAADGGRGTVSVYDVHSHKKRKVLGTQESMSKEYVCMSFSAENKYLLTQGGAPDYALICWVWEKAKPVATTRVSNAQGPSKRFCRTHAPS